MNWKLCHKSKTARVRRVFTAALILACALSMATYASAQVTPPTPPDGSAIPVGNSAHLVGHAHGSQGYTFLPTSTGGTAWNPSARPEATLFADFFGHSVQIITHLKHQ